MFLQLIHSLFFQEEGSGTYAAPSSSKMISFELSNGDPFGPGVPASIDDDDYVEYPLDNMADFPSNVDEEERVSMLNFTELHRLIIGFSILLYSFSALTFLTGEKNIRC